HQYGLYFSACAARAAATAESASNVTWLTYATGPQPAAARHATITHRRIAPIISPGAHSPPVTAKLDRHVDRGSEQGQERHDERPAELDREQRHPVVRRVADEVRRRGEPVHAADDEDQQR